MSKATPPAKEQLPAFTSFEECLQYSKGQRDNFYVTAFMLEAWLGTIVTKVVEEYAHRRAGKRRLQTGIGWEAWNEVFGHAKPNEWGHIMECLARFSNCDTPDAELVATMIAIIGTEDKYAEFVPSVASVREAIKSTLTLKGVIDRMRDTFRRMSEWMEAVVHWHVHWMAAVAPFAFDPDEGRRELAGIGLMQAGFAEMNAHSKAWWNFRHEDLSKRFQGKKDWRLVGKAQSFEKWGELKRSRVDELTIYWWPLGVRFGWTDRDMRGLMRGVLPNPETYPLREDREFADYRAKVLGLRKAKEERDKSTPDGKPPGWRVALAMIDKLSE